MLHGKWNNKLLDDLLFEFLCFLPFTGDIQIGNNGHIICPGLDPWPLRWSGAWGNGGGKVATAAAYTEDILESLMSSKYHCSYPHSWILVELTSTSLSCPDRGARAIREPNALHLFFGLHLASVPRTRRVKSHVLKDKQKLHNHT